MRVADGDTLPWQLTSAPASSSSRTRSSTPSRQAGRLRSRVCKGPPPSLATPPAASLAPTPLSLAPPPLAPAPPPPLSLAPSPAAESGGRRLRGQWGVSSQCSRSCEAGKWTQQSAKEKNTKIRIGVPTVFWSMTEWQSCVLVVWYQGRYPVKDKYGQRIFCCRMVLAISSVSSDSGKMAPSFPLSLSPPRIWLCTAVYRSCLQWPTLYSDPHLLPSQNGQKYLPLFLPISFLLRSPICHTV